MDDIVRNNDNNGRHRRYEPIVLTMSSLVVRTRSVALGVLKCFFVNVLCIKQQQLLYLQNMRLMNERQKRHLVAF